MKVFVIMPINDGTVNVFETIQNVCKKFRIECVRADKILTPGVIIQQIQDSINDAHLLLADLSSKEGNIFNANVFYEVGYADALKKTPILIADKHTFDAISLPFDIKHRRIIAYDKDNLTDLFDLLYAQINNILKYNKSILSQIDDPFGVSKPIFSYKNKLQIENHLEVNDELLVSLYKGGLERVKKRFWTTTYLTSGFWAHGKDDIYHANESMLKRVSKSKDVKRIFLLQNDISTFLRDIGKNVIDCRNRKDIRGMEIIMGNFQRLKETCRRFMHEGCLIKYCHDRFAFQALEDFKENDTEIALYDDFRVDYFDGGHDGRISGVRIYTKNHPSFIRRKISLERYHEKVWESGDDINNLFILIENTYKYYSEKIDYSFPKLMRFDSIVNNNDFKLKEDEKQKLINFLTQSDHFKKVHNYLDIGTCTGRYPFELSEHLKNPNTFILGLDADADCVEYCKTKMKLKDTHLPNQVLAFKESDFLKSDDHILVNSYDLITCMLGTISNFGWDKSSSSRHKDDLHKSLAKMQSVLAQDGLLVISNWTEVGLNTEMLEIYDDLDRKKLRDFTEPKHILQERLEDFFEIISVETTIDSRLDIFFCRLKKNNKK